MGLTGPNAAGKGEVATFLVATGYSYHSLSDVVRRAATRQGLELSRENLVRIGNELRLEGGPGALVHQLLAHLAPPAVVDSIRNPGEVEALREAEGFFLIGVRAPAELRFERIRARGRLGDISTVDEFRSFESAENSADSTKQRITATLELADVVLENAGSLDDLQRTVCSALDGARKR